MDPFARKSRQDGPNLPFVVVCIAVTLYFKVDLWPMQQLVMVLA